MLNINDDDSPIENVDDETEGESESLDISQAFIDHDLEKLIGTKKKGAKEDNFPKELYVLPLTRRPFFPGMAAPLVIEPGPYYEILKIVAKSPDKMLGLFLTKEEEVNIYDIEFKDLCKVGVLASILRIVPLEHGGAQVVLNMEKRIQIKKPLKKNKYLRAEVHYHSDTISEDQSKIINNNPNSYQ